MTIKQWSGNVVERTYEGHTDSVRALCEVPGLGFVSGSHDMTLRAWTLAGDCIATLVGHTALIYACAATAKVLASGAPPLQSRAFAILRFSALFVAGLLFLHILQGQYHVAIPGDAGADSRHTRPSRRIADSNACLSPGCRIRGQHCAALGPDGAVQASNLFPRMRVEPCVPALGRLCGGRLRLQGVRVL